MTDTETDLKDLWRKQPTAAVELSLKEIQRSAARFHSSIRWRNALEYVACVAVVLIFGRHALLHLDQPAFAASSGLIALASVWVVYYLYRYGRPLLPPYDCDSKAHLVFVARELRLQSELLQRAMWWYVAPFVPGMVMFTALNPKRKFGLTGMLLTFALFFAAVIVWNLFHARRLRAGADHVESMVRTIEEESANSV